MTPTSDEHRRRVIGSGPHAHVWIIVEEREGCPPYEACYFCGVERDAQPLLQTRGAQTGFDLASAFYGDPATRIEQGRS